MKKDVNKSNSNADCQPYEILSSSKARKVRFINNFCIKAIKKKITQSYNKEFYTKYITTEKENLNVILSDTPEIYDSIFISSYLIGICYIAMFKSFRSMGVSVEQSNKNIWISTETLLKKIPKVLVPLAKKAYINPMIKKAVSHTEKSKSGQLPEYDWNVEYIKIDDNCFQLNTYECGLKKLCKKFSSEEMLPSLCRMDYLTSHYLHCGFERDKTLGDADEVCNNTFYIKGDCAWAPEKGFTYRK